MTAKTHKKREKEIIKVRIIEHAAYRDDGSSFRQVAPATYGVFELDKQVATILKGKGGWRCALPGETSKIGLIVSPFGTDSFRDVRAWALMEFWQRSNTAKGEKACV